MNTRFQDKVEERKLMKIIKLYWVVLLNIFYFHPYLGKIPILTNICFKGVETTN